MKPPFIQTSINTIGCFPEWSIPSLPLTLCLTLFIGLNAPILAHADNYSSAEEKGLKIARDADEKDSGFGNYTAQQTMVLRNRQGQESLRRLRVKILEVPEDGDKTLFVFDDPRDVQGTAFLIHAHEDAPDDQWIYLPALRRVKRISSSNRSGSFMGSEFAYEDLTTQAVEKFTYRYLRDEPCGSLTCYVVERIPTDKDSGYKRQLVWFDQDELRAQQIYFYDRRDSHMKTLTFEGYAQYLDRFWRARLMTMVNHATGKSTTMTWTDFQFQTDLSDHDFTRTGLRRAR